MKKFFVTTPIYYVNDILISATPTRPSPLTLLRGIRGLSPAKRTCFFTPARTSTGRRSRRPPLAAGKIPKVFADGVVVRFKELWKRLNISNDVFIRTTEDRHKAAVQELWRRVKEKGDIYKGSYEDWYCVPCETFITEKEVVRANALLARGPLKR